MKITSAHVASLFLTLREGDLGIGSATGFVVERSGQRFLVTNRHVVRGKGNPPNRLGILHNKSGETGAFVERVEGLYNTETGEPLWYEHPVHPAAIDVAALPLTETDGIDTYLLDPWSVGPDLATGVTSALAIVGFPFGVTSGGGMGVWVRGFTATEPGLDYGNLPCFLIDSRTRPGQSGSPVLNFSSGGMTEMADGGSGLFASAVWRFCGIYSGRISEQSDLGFVWKPEAIQAVIDGAALAKL